MNKDLVYRPPVVSVCRADQSGYALPSVLLMVVVFSSIAVSSILLLYFERQNALIQVARVKAEYASQSGIAQEVAALSINPTTHQYPDGSISNTKTISWGVFFAANSIGHFCKTSQSHTAIVANIPSGVFNYAFVLGNANHQLICSGDSHIKGDVVVGKSGVTTGTLPGYPTPRQISIDGGIIRQAVPALPSFDRTGLQDQIKKWMSQEGQQARLIAKGSLDLTSVPDSITMVECEGNLRIGGKIHRNSYPLTIRTSGCISFEQHVSISGLVLCISSGELLVVTGIKIDNAILFCSDSVRVEQGADFAGQIVSPSVNLERGAWLRYPSAIVSDSIRGNKNQRIVLKTGASVEGIVMMLGEKPQTMTSALTIEKGAKVVGSVYSQVPATIDGEVFGSVFVQDLYFYLSPTRYYGWMRTGNIDRSKLPNGYMVPVGFSQSTNCGVLDWL